MYLILFLTVSAVILSAAYRLMAGRLARFLDLDLQAATPAHALRDGVDYEPARKWYLLPQHFSAIAAAGPIVGPILAAHYFGWLPVWLWVLCGSILIGGIHDFTILAASVRHQGRSLAELVNQYMNRRAYLLFLLFVWISLLYVIVAFTDITAGTFLHAGADTEAAANGQAVATSSLLYLSLAVVMGLVIRYGRVSSNKAKLFFLPLVVAAIVVGPYVPLDVTRLLPGVEPRLVWNYVLLSYCFLAALAPVWLLLQPRGDLGGYFLYLLMIAGVIGAFVGGLSGSFDMQLAAVKDIQLFGYAASGTAVIPPLIPVLFITVACGACSGFHSVVASGTTSKQLDNERDGVLIGYGGMLLEAFLACISIAALAILAQPKLQPDHNYASGIAKFIHAATFGLVTENVAFRFGLLCFATFVFDTLDACTRLARYVLAELTGWAGARGRIAATAVTMAVPAVMVSLPPQMDGGKVVPMWKEFWELFGTSNQLLVALSLLVVSVWLQRLGKRIWLTLPAALFMLSMTLLSLTNLTAQYLGAILTGGASILQYVRLSVTLLLIGMALAIGYEAWSFLRRGAKGPEIELPVEAGA